MLGHVGLGFGIGVGVLGLGGLFWGFGGVVWGLGVVHFGTEHQPVAILARNAGALSIPNSVRARGLGT